MTEDERLAAVRELETGGWTLEAVEQRHILWALSVCQGNKTKTARLLGSDRRTLYRKLKKYGAIK